MFRSQRDKRCDRVKADQISVLKSNKDYNLTRIIRLMIEKCELFLMEIKMIEHTIAYNSEKERKKNQIIKKKLRSDDKIK